MGFKLSNIFTTLIIVLALSISLHGQVFWNEVNSGVSVALRSVSNVNGHIAWVCGASGTVIRTTNDGYNWANVSGNGIPAIITLINIYGVDATTALTAGYIGTNTYVYRTSNGGSNWTQVFSQNNGFINAVWMTSALNGFMEGDPVGVRWSLWRSTNAGINWDSSGLRLPRAGTEAGFNNSLWVQSGKIWFGTNNSRIYYSSNNGLNWSQQSTLTEVNSYAVSFDTTAGPNGLTGGSALLRTTNGGANWINVTTTGTGGFTGLAFSRDWLNMAWYIRSSNTIFGSFYPFTSWGPQYTAPSGTYYHISVSRQTGFGPGGIYAVRSNGGISRGNIFIEGVRLISNEIPAAFKLYQNYPNPFNPVTRIRLEIPKLRNNISGEVMGSLIVIKVYNAIGKEIETVLEQVTQPGIYEAEWDGTNYPSGVYYYRVLTKDPKYSVVEQRETKKMVLLK